MIKKLLSYLFALLILSFLQGCNTQTPDPAENKIACLYDDEDERFIMIMNADGSDSYRLNTGMVEDGCPHWSPDGERILFVSANGMRQPENNDLYVINVDDDTTLTRLTVGRFVYNASFSPDGTKIAFTAYTSNAINLFVMDADGSNIVQLTDQITFDQSPAWIDDQTILFSSNRGDRERAVNDNYDIYSITIDGEQITRLTDGPEFDYIFNPPQDYAPNVSVNNQIAFHTRQLLDPAAEDFSKVEYISVMAADGSDRRIITPVDRALRNLNPSWSPDGDYLVFISNRDYLGKDVQNFDIYTMRPDGSDHTRITVSGHVLCPEWRP